MASEFTEMLLRWNAGENSRQMPWKGEKDPYRIWLSEVILQQTRVEQGLDYYHRFLGLFPTITDLAMAPDEKVFKAWEGLGYYSRCRNLLATARFIALERGGRFPDRYEEILQLRGVGPYTAAAIASFAFGLAHAVLDGNVYRVLSRFFGIDTPIDSPEGKKQFTALAELLLDRSQPGIYNQAIMDFGAQVCKPQAPLCSGCPMRNACHALREGKVAQLPVKSKRIRRRERFFYYYILRWKGQYYIRCREGGDIWQDLHEWVLVERPEPLEGGGADFKKELRRQFRTLRGRVLSVSPARKQQLTHLTITGQFIHMELDSPLPDHSGYRLVNRQELARVAFPRFISSYLETHPL